MQNNMNILIIVSSLGTGGTEYSVLRKVKYFKKRYNANFYIIALSGGELKKEFESTKTPIFIVSKKYSIFQVFDFVRFILENEIDIIHSYLYHSNVIGSIIRIFINKPLLISIRSALPSYKSYKFSTILVALLDSFLSRYTAKKIIFNNRKGIDDHCKKLFYCKRKCVYIPKMILDKNLFF